MQHVQACLSDREDLWKHCGARETLFMCEKDLINPF